MNDVIDLGQKLDAFDETWHPRIIGACNGQYLKLAHGAGSLEWHRHDLEDEAFLCLRGRLVLEMRDREVALEPGQLFIMPRGVEHRPRAEPTASVLLFEPAETEHLGGAGGSREVDVRDQPWI